MPVPRGDGDFEDGIGDLLHHVIALNERHLKRPMNDYILYYRDERIRLALDIHPPGLHSVAPGRI
jgi:hypothetical protein